MYVPVRAHNGWNIGLQPDTWNWEWITYYKHICLYKTFFVQIKLNECIMAKWSLSVWVGVIHFLDSLADFDVIWYVKFIGRIQLWCVLVNIFPIFIKTEDKISLSLKDRYLFCIILHILMKYKQKLESAQCNVCSMNGYAKIYLYSQQQKIKNWYQSLYCNQTVKLRLNKVYLILLKKMFRSSEPC
jgi:hypothetical protein